MARRAKGEGSVYKDKQGNWNGQILLGRDENGKPKYKKFKSSRQSEVIKRMNEYKLSTGIADTNSINTLTLDHLITLYNNLKQMSIRKTSFDSMIVNAKQVNQYIGHYNVQNITPEIIQTELINAMIDKGYAYGTIHKAYTYLNECMKFALQKDYIVKNPCEAVKLPAKENFDTKKKRFLTDDEIARFKETAITQRKTINMPLYEYGNIITLIIYTGLRVGELSAIKWADIDYNTRTIHINKTIVVEYHNGVRTLVESHTTKSGKSRTVPINNKSFEILQRQKELVGGSESDYIVNGSKQIPDKTVVAKSYTNIAKRAEIPNPSGIHTLRHTFASLAIRKGVDIKVISEILGHASTSFTYNTYVHIIDEQKHNAVDLLNDI